MKKAVIILSILCAITLTAFIARGNRAGGVEVQVEPLGMSPISSSILASGKITYDEKASLTAEIIGIVKAMHVKEGDAVKKGDLVLEIRDDEYVAAVRQTKAAAELQESAIKRAELNLERLRLQLERNNRLLESKLIARDAFDQFKLEYDIAVVDRHSADTALAQARAQWEQAVQRLSKTRIYAPFDGVVTSVDIKEGETAIPSTGGIAGSTLLTIANPSSIYTQVNVDEADIGNVSVGDHAEVIAVAYPGAPIQGRVESMGTSAKVAEGRQGLSFAVKIRLEQRGTAALLPGMSCRAEIVTRSHNAVLAAPIQSIVAEEDHQANKTHHFVFISRDNVAYKQPITTGIADENYQEIKSGANAGDLVIVGPDKVLQKLRQGDTVVVRRNAAVASR